MANIKISIEDNIFNTHLNLINKNGLTFDNNRITINYYCIERSASTVIAENLSKIININRLRHENWEVANMATYRDFRDVAVSIWRKLHYTENFEYMEIEHIIKYAEDAKYEAKHLTDIFDKKIKPVFFAKYEDYYKDFSIFLNAFLNFFDLELSSEVYDIILNGFDFDAAKKRYNSNVPIYTIGQTSNRGTGYHHIDTGEVGKWKKWIREKDWCIINTILKEYLEYWGYEL